MRLPQGGKDICAAGDLLVLCNRYGLPIAARSVGEFQEASEAPVFIAILAERATPKFDQRTAARRVELKMARRLRCVSVTARKGHAPSSRLGGGPYRTQRLASHTGYTTLAPASQSLLRH